MKKELYQTIEIPEGVEVKMEDNKIVVKGPEGEISKDLKLGKIDFKIEGKEITLGDKKATKSEKKIINTNTAHIKNMIKGVQEKFEYVLKVCSSHFPMTVSVEGNTAKIKNFLGEKRERSCKIPAGVEVNVQKDIITITSPNKELAGQAAANFEKSTKISNRDRRVFQDGIYITSKCGKEI